MFVSHYERPPIATITIAQTIAASFKTTAMHSTKRPVALLTRCRSFIWGALLFLLPSFCNTHGGQGLAQARPSSLDRRQTAHLDGLRGMAAMAVYAMHMSMAIDRNSLLGFVDGVSAAYYNLPILRLFRSGKAMVRIFFVLSGYALSLSPARYLDHPCAAAKLHRSLAVATLKRPFRLFLPPLATTAVVLLLVSMRLFPTAQSMEALPAHLPAQTVVRRPSFPLQVADWLGFITHKLTNPWDWVEDLYVSDADSYYGAHLWTIQTEFRCSLILFTTLAAISVLARPVVRHLAVGFFTIYCTCWGRWDVALFLAGLGLCTVNGFAQRESTYLPPTTANGAQLSKGRQRWQRCRGSLVGIAQRMAPLLLLIAGLWALSYPDDKADQALGFGSMSELLPSADFWQSLGAVAVVWSAGEVQVAKVFLNSTPLQYLGSLSFSLYLVHYPFLEIVGWKFLLLCREYLASALVLAGIDSGPEALIGNIFGFFLVTSGLLWISDLTMRIVDLPSQRLIGWLVSSLC